MSTMIAPDKEVISAARALSDSAYDLADQREAIEAFIERGNHLYEVLQVVELSPGHLLNRSMISLLEFSSQSLHSLREIIVERQHFTEVLPILDKILPELDSLINTAIVALDPKIWEMSQALDRGESNRTSFESLEAAARHFGFEWEAKKAETYLAD